jgi:hypothetical protein
VCGAARDRSNLALFYLLFVSLTVAEHYALRPLREEEAALQRSYHRPRGVSNWDNLRTGDPYGNSEVAYLEKDHGRKAELFLGIFSKGATAVEKKRAEHLASLVRWLCLPVNQAYAASSDRFTQNLRKNGPWNAISMLQSLEYLEISAYWRPPRNFEPFEAPEELMSKLQTLKLRGYVPAEFVQFVCANASSIANLQLGVINNPIGSANISGRENPPPPVDSEDEDAEDFADAENIAPRPLTCLSPQIISKFSSLTNLYLCRPSEGAYPDHDAYCEVYTSRKSDTSVLHEWASLLRVARATLTRITFDQRIVAEENAPDGNDSANFVEEYCNGNGYQRFVEIVLPVLLEEAKWPALKSIWLFGFEAEDARNRKRSVDLVRKLGERFGEGVQICNGSGRWMLIWDDSGEIQPGGDVLDSTVDCEWEDENVPI